VESQPKNPGQIERINLKEQIGGIYIGSLAVGVLGLIAAIGIGAAAGDGFKRFYFSYLIGFIFFLAIALGGLSFTMIQHTTKAGWSVNVRRLAECFASTLPLMALLSVPIFVSVLMGRDDSLYPWAGPSYVHAGFKGWWLTKGFFVARAVLYFIVWGFLGWRFWKWSVEQDETGDIELTKRMQYWGPLGLVFLGLTLTFAAWDWIMSLDPVWYSTIFGVYFFAGCALANFSTLILVVRFLQSRGMLTKSVTVEHFHDLGKFLFGFTFFWGYIAFSQFMLQWYGNIPDEASWFIRHGASTMYPNQFSPLVILLLFGHFLIPFPGLLSRHIKRNPKTLAFWAVWMICFCWIDIYWLIEPQFAAVVKNGVVAPDTTLQLGPLDILEHLSVLVGIGGIFAAFVIHRASQYAIRPIHDPRLVDSLAYENF
jgi:hypothetical protein